MINTEPYTTISDVIEYAIIPALGEYGGDYDLEGIAREAYEWSQPGNLNTRGFRKVVSDEEFWRNRGTSRPHGKVIRARGGRRYL